MNNPPAAPPRFVSVGHSNHPLEHFVRLLQRHGVTTVVDVRSQPYSQRYPQFNGPELEGALPGFGLAYVFLGNLLGGRPEQPSVYDRDGRVDYERVRATAGFRRGIDQLFRMPGESSVALMCSEEDPLDCHRGLMIAPALVERGVLPEHLRGSGALESTEQFERRLLAATGVGDGMLDGLFATALSAEERAECLREAYRVQARRKAFRLSPEQTAALRAGECEDYPDE